MTDNDHKTHIGFQRAAGSSIRSYLGCRWFTHEDGRNRQFAAASDSYPPTLRPLKVDGVMRCDYATEGTRVYYGTEELVGADLASFRPIGKGYTPWARDKARLYYAGRPVEGDIDLATFHCIDEACQFQADAVALIHRRRRIAGSVPARARMIGHHALTDGVVVLYAHRGDVNVVEGAVATAFAELGHATFQNDKRLPVYGDGVRVYVGSTPVVVKNAMWNKMPEPFALDAATFRFLGCDAVADRQGVYTPTNLSFSHHAALDGLTFEFDDDCRGGRDRNYRYRLHPAVWGSWVDGASHVAFLSPVESVGGAPLKVFGGGYWARGAEVFFGLTRLVDADATSFELLADHPRRPVARDRAHVWVAFNLVADADPTSFTFIGHARDTAVGCDRQFIFLGDSKQQHGWNRGGELANLAISIESRCPTAKPQER